ncbi:hypothetical protein ACJX0J_008374, partial [Zea mays]
VPPCFGCWCDLAFIPATGIDGRVGYCFRRRGPGGVAWPGFAMLLGFLHEQATVETEVQQVEIAEQELIE